MVAAVALAAKLFIAATTYGTNDVWHWTDFAQGVHRAGPVGVYDLTFPFSFYNHPPLIGYFLFGVNLLGRWGVSLSFTIRSVASLADVATALLVFEILRRRRPLAEATVAGVLVAASPVLLLVSGFHGNTDPVFTMLTFLSLFLLADLDRPAWAGAAMGLALGVKIVPVVIVPCLLLFAIRRNLATAARYAAGTAAVLAVTWTPAIIREWEPLKHNVLGYSGINQRQWGLVQLATWAEHPHWVKLLGEPGHLVTGAVAAAVPALIVWRAPRLVAEAVGLGFAIFLALSPAFGMQYLAWVAAGCFLFSLWGALAYNVVAGALLFHVYNRWNGGMPWNIGFASPLTPAEVVGAMVVWVVLVVVTGQALIGSGLTIRWPWQAAAPSGSAMVRMGSTSASPSQWKTNGYGARETPSRTRQVE